MRQSTREETSSTLSQPFDAVKVQAACCAIAPSARHPDGIAPPQRRQRTGTKVSKAAPNFSTSPWYRHHRDCLPIDAHGGPGKNVCEGTLELTHIQVIHVAKGAGSKHDQQT